MNIKDVPQWLLWRYDNGQKRPVNRWGEFSGSTHRHDYMTFDEAVAADAELTTIGLAFCFTSNDPFVGIDLDDCLDSELVIKDWADPILGRFAGTYAEISPSLTGIKIYCQGKMPEGMSHQVSCGDGGIEVYEDGRFFAFTGLMWRCDTNENVTDQQEVIDWLFEEYWPKPKKTKAAKPNGATRVSGPLTIVRRARDYITAAERPLPGGRNNQAFSIAKHLREIMHDGEILSDDQVLDFVQEWNRLLPVPLTEEEIEQVVKSACSKPRTGEWKTELPPRAEIDPDVDLSGILNGRPSNGKPTAKPPLPPPIPFPSELFHIPGFVGELTQYMIRSTIYPQDQLSLAATLSLLSVLTGRKVQDDYRGTRTNVYVLGVAPTASGKEHARQINKEVLLRAGCPELAGPERIGSSAGLVSRLVRNPACLFQIDEFGRFLHTMRNPGKAAHLYNVATVLMQLYSSVGTYWIGDAYADVKRTPEIYDPHAVVYGTTTPAAFWGGLTKDNVADGLLGRLMLFEGEYVDVHRASKDPIPSSVIDAAAFWAGLNPGGGNLNPEPLIAKYEEAALIRLEEHLGEIAKRRKTEEEAAAALWSRVGERTAKLALLFACSRATTDIWITLQDVNYAVLLSNWMARRLLRAVGLYLSENPIEDNVKRVRRIIVDNPGMTKSELTRKTQWLRKRDRDEILGQLIEMEFITTVESTGTNGRIQLNFYPEG